MPWNKNVLARENGKVEKYTPLGKEMNRLYQVRSRVVPLVIGHLGAISKPFEKYFQEFGIRD